MQWHLRLCRNRGLSWGWRAALVLLSGLISVAATGCGPQSTGGQYTPTPVDETPGETPGETPNGTPGVTPTPADNTTPPDDTTSAPTPDPSALGGFYIAGSFPQDGAMAVPGMFMAWLYFSEPYTEDPAGIEGSITGRSGRTLALTDGRLSEDSLAVGFPVELWPEDFSYTMTVSIPESDFLDADWPLDYTIKFTTGGIPCDLTYNLYPELKIVALGGDPDPNATPVPEITPSPEPGGTPYPTPEPTPLPDNRELLALLNAMLTDTGADFPTALFLKGIPQNVDFPVPSFQSALASVYQVDGTLYSIYPDTGVSSQLSTCAITERGALTCSDERAAFPLLYATVQLYIYVQQAEVKAALDESGNVQSMTDFSLEGYMLAQDLFNLMNSVGYGYLADKVVLDVDSDGDGLPDSASIKLTSQPEQIFMAQCVGG